MAKKWSDEDIEAAIEAAFSQLGYPVVKAEQREAAREFVKGQDVSVSIPTGSGKSLCYGCLPLVFNSLRAGGSKAIVVVVSPLKALMLDQVRAFSAKGLESAYVSSDEDIARGVENGDYSLVFMSPEALVSSCRWREIFRMPVYQENLVAVVVDEAHCIEKWGASFRTEFARIAEVRSLIPRHVRMMALTATATVSTRGKIILSLNMKGCHVISRNPWKANIKYIVRKKTSIEDDFLPIIDDVGKNNLNAERTIIFCRNFGDCFEIYQSFQMKLKQRMYYPPTAPQVSKYRLVDMFTSITEESVKTNIIQNFTSPHGCCRVVIGTIAFGMGLDSPNVRKVIHWGPSADIESYVQESGRIGRDGQPAIAVLFFEDSDLSSIKHVSQEMKEYCKNVCKCRKDILFAGFDQSTTVHLSVPHYVQILVAIYVVSEHFSLVLYSRNYNLSEFAHKTDFPLHSHICMSFGI